jgi:hypothetical protein
LRTIKSEVDFESAAEEDAGVEGFPGSDVWDAAVAGMTESASAKAFHRAGRKGRTAKNRKCNKMLRGHFSGKPLEALLELQSVTKNTGHFFHGSPRSASDARVCLTKFLAERAICSERWAREIVKELFQKRWLEISAIDGRVSILVRQHRDWGALTNSPTCFYSATATSSGDEPPSAQTEENSARTEESSAETEENAVKTEGPSAKSTVSPIDASFTEPSSEAVPDVEPEGGQKTGTASQCPTPSAPGEKRKAVEARSDLSVMTESASVHRMNRYGRKLRLNGKALETAMALVEEYGPEDVADAYENYIDDDSSFLCERKHPWAIFAKQFEDYQPDPEVEVERVVVCRCGRRRTETVWTTTPQTERFAHCWFCDECKVEDVRREARLNEEKVQGLKAERQQTNEKLNAALATFERYGNEENMAEQMREVKLRYPMLVNAQEKIYRARRDAAQLEIEKLRRKIEDLDQKEETNNGDRFREG